VISSGAVSWPGITFCLTGLPDESLRLLSVPGLHSSGQSLELWKLVAGKKAGDDRQQNTTRDKLAKKLVGYYWVWIFF
jgi:hypothetical protein